MKDFSVSFPKDVKITGRTSTIRGSFIKAIIPSIKPTEKEIHQALKLLNQSKVQLSCVYCGDKASEWEHFRSIVINKLPSGYITEIYNLVPACGKCNQSKRSQYWKTWMTGKAKHSPKSRGIPFIEQKIKRLDSFESWSNKYVTKLPIDLLKIPSLKKYLNSCEKLIATFKNYQIEAEKIKVLLAKHANNG